MFDRKLMALQALALLLMSTVAVGGAARWSRLRRQLLETSEGGGRKRSSSEAQPGRLLVNFRTFGLGAGAQTWRGHEGDGYGRVHAPHGGPDTSREILAMIQDDDLPTLESTSSLSPGDILRLLRQLRKKIATRGRRRRRR